MNSLTMLIKRNIKFYYRYKSNIVYSFLSVMIIIGLNILFLSKMTTDGFAASFPGIDRAKLSFLTDSIMFAALIPISSLSVSLVALSVMVNDVEKKINLDFMTAPIKRSVIMLSYLLSSLIICLVVALIFIAFSGVYLFIESGVFFSPLQIFYMLAATLLSVLFSNIIILYIMSFLKTENGVGGLGTLIGTLIGFISGAYMPIGVMPEAIRYVINVLPFLQTTALIKQAYLPNVAKVLGDVDLTEVYKLYGSDIYFKNFIMPPYLLIISIIAYTVLFGILALIRFRKLQNK